MYSRKSSQFSRYRLFLEHIMVKLTISQVSKSYADRDVLFGVSAEVRTGQCLVVAGPNGSGKSTLLRIIAGITRPTSGGVNLVIDGRPVSSAGRTRIIGLVSPDLTLYDELTCEENLRFFARVRGLSLSSDELDAALAAVGLSGRGRDLIKAYSTGMKQRAKFAYALIHSPRVLLLDEPSSNLDEAGRELVAGIIRRQLEDGIVVMATNDPAEVRYGDVRVHLG